MSRGTSWGNHFFWRNSISSRLRTSNSQTFEKNLDFRVQIFPQVCQNSNLRVQKNTLRTKNCFKDRKVFSFFRNLSIKLSDFLWKNFDKVVKTDFYVSSGTCRSKTIFQMNFSNSFFWGLTEKKSKYWQKICGWGWWYCNLSTKSKVSGKKQVFQKKIFHHFPTLDELRFRLSEDNPQ